MAFKIILNHIGPKFVDIYINSIKLRFLKQKNGFAMCEDLINNDKVKTITIYKKSIYDSPLVWLNVLNPIYYIYQMRFFDVNPHFYDEKFLSYEVRVLLSDEFSDDILNIQYAELNHQPTMRFVVKNGCIEYVKKNKMPEKSIQRWKFSRIVCAIIFTILLNSILILDFISTQPFNYVLLLALLLIDLQCINICRLAWKAKSVFDKNEIGD